MSILHHYLLWHYTRALGEILHIWTNFFWFVINLFSLPQLLRSYFSPWKRIVEEKGRKFNLEDFASYLLIGLISRLIGILLRTMVILVGTIVLLLLVLGIIVVYTAWLLAPVLIGYSLIYGLILIFS